MKKAPIVPVLLCGGSGSRLWPLSREAYPKQFLSLLGRHTLFQQTALRFADRERFGTMVVVTNEDHRFIVAEQLRAIGIDDAIIVIEPVGRNTAPAAAAAALHVQEHDPDALILLLPTDHVIANPDVMIAAVERGIQSAKGGHIVLFGIEPTTPATGYGYIRIGDLLTPGVHTAGGFIEKPDEETAAEYLASHKYVWNSGIFLAGVRCLLSEIERHAPAVIDAARGALVDGDRDLMFLRLGLSFGHSPSISLDHAVMEHTDNAALVPMQCGWNDLGAWSALWDIGEKDEWGNVIAGEAVIENAQGCYLRGEGPLIAAVGIDDLIVIATDDVVLVTRRDHDQDVKSVVERLKKEGRSAAVSTRRVHRPWGSYEAVLQGHRFQVKRITVNPGAKLSLQKHYHRAEHWVVVNGTALVTRDDEQLLVRENESVYLPLGAVHRLENPGKLPLNLIEVQSGAYLGEDDIVRLDDVYHRCDRAALPS
jgi:mannose-1-phosphate guanylyltransferase/mannose-6-phosphate isomerase